MSFFDGGGAGLIAGGAGLIGGLLANSQNRRESQRNRDFQAGMSNTSHQREVKDLEAAGLNPLLSATGGASTPSGSQASQENAVAGAVGSALEASRLKKDIALADAQISATAAAANKDNTSARESAARINVIEKQMPAIISQARKDKNQADIDYKMSTFDNVLNRASQTGGTLLNMKQLIKGKPSWQGQTPGGTIYHKHTGEILKP